MFCLCFVSRRVPFRAFALHCASDGARETSRGVLACGSSGPGRWVGITRYFGRAEVADGGRPRGMGRRGAARRTSSVVKLVRGKPRRTHPGFLARSFAQAGVNPRWLSPVHARRTARWRWERFSLRWCDHHRTQTCPAQTFVALASICAKQWLHHKRGFGGRG